MVDQAVIVAIAFCYSSWNSTCTASSYMGLGETSVLLPGLSGCFSVVLMITYRKGRERVANTREQAALQDVHCEVEE